MKKLFLIACIAIIPFISHSQKNTDNIRLYLDCKTRCDMSFIKTEMNYIDFVSDRFTSNVYVMVTAQTTGSGGQEIMLYFNGQEQFKGMKDTLQFNRSSIGTDGEYRSQLVQYLKLGLTRYLAKTGIASKLNISVAESEDGPLNAKAKTDPWNYWVMNMRVNGSYEKDDYSKEYSYNTSFDASRTTEKLKVRNRVYYNKSVQEITIDDKDVYTSEEYGAKTNLVTSISKHWSYGAGLQFEYSSYSNLKSNFGVKPAIEYSFFPYKESVKKALTLYYDIGPNWVKYIDTPYYGEFAPFKDNLMMHSLSLNFGLIQNWGNAYAYVNWESFLNDFHFQGKRIKGKDVRNFSVGASLDVRIFKGLSLSSAVEYEITKGIYPNIRQSDFDVDDILSNTRQYPTSNNFEVYLGLNYRFGSIYNNVVNPRFNRVF
jgi:hypothetical protein